MKARNKKTGSIYLTHQEAVDFYYYKPTNEGSELVREHFDSIAALNKKWEDYKPAEPLIKDKKICKTLRAWRDCNEDDCFYITDDSRIEDGSGRNIDFHGQPFYGMKHRHYTIQELCGEEE